MLMLDLNRFRPLDSFHRVLAVGWAGMLLAAAAPASGAGAPSSYSSYVELRIYETKPGQADDFLDHFERYYLEPQEEWGLRIWTQALDLEDAGHVVWMRGYRNLAERVEGLRGFYTSALWRETGGRAVSMLAGRATHVHFLEPADAESGFVDADRLSASSSTEHPGGLLSVQVYALDERDASPATKEQLLEMLRDEVIPLWVRNGAIPLGLFIDSSAENAFPVLPVLDEEVVVWISSFTDEAAFRRAQDSVRHQLRPTEQFALVPGRRSRLRAHPGHEPELP